MEGKLTEQAPLCSHSPPAKLDSALDGPRRELMLPQDSTLPHDSSQNDVKCWGQCLAMSEKTECDSLNFTKMNNVCEISKAEYENLQSSQGYDLGYSVKNKQQRTNQDDVVFKGSRHTNMDLVYISQGSKSKSSVNSSCDDQVSNENRSSSGNNVIHKVPVPRQDSVTCDFNLGSPIETFNSSTTEFPWHGGNQPEDTSSTYNNNNKTQVYHGQKEKGAGQNSLQGQNLTKQIFPANTDLRPSSEPWKMNDRNQFFSKCTADSEWRIAQGGIPEICRYGGPDISQTQSGQKNAKSYSFDNIENSDDSQSTDHSTQNNYNVHTDRDTMWVHFCQCAKFFFIMVVMVMLVYLHVRVTALESSVVSTATTRCQCDQKILAHESLFIDKSKRANGEIPDSHFKDTQERVVTYFDNKNQEQSEDSDTAKLFIRHDNNKNIQPNQTLYSSESDQGGNKSSNRMNSYNPSTERVVNTKRVETNASADVLNFSDNNAKDQSFQKISGKGRERPDLPRRDFKAVETVPEINDIRRIELTDFELDQTGHQLSRHRRNPGKKANDPSFKKKIKKPSSKEPRNNGPQVESFHIPYWSEFFHYPKHFNSQDPLSINHDCTTQHSWGHGIEACKDSSIIFPKQHSILPFYRPTKTTAEKDVKKRMINVDDHGRFHVIISGDYLFQQNITILSDSEKHFLALYLNDRATLACQHGGFVCPHTNEENSSKYKVCTIIGVLELLKGDVVDIRTMGSHMKVLAEVHHKNKSHIKFILLNKIKDQ